MIIGNRAWVMGFYKLFYLTSCCIFMIEAKSVGFGSVTVCPEFDNHRSNVVIYQKAEYKDCLKSSLGMLNYSK